VTCDGALVGQSDGYPWGDTYPFAAWESGEIQVDIRHIRLEAPVQPGCLRVLTGLYYETDVMRLAASDPESGESMQDHAVIVPLTETRPTVDTGND
jgi:hypothetical protein